MLGFKRFDHAAVTISGIELAEKIKKGQFQDGQAGRPKGDDVGVLERRIRCLSPTELPVDLSLHQSPKNGPKRPAQNVGRFSGRKVQAIPRCKGKPQRVEPEM
jgi:hypothetical protein